MAERAIHLVRHGETEWNKIKRVQGSQDRFLSLVGIEQVEKLIRELEGVDISTIFTSPLKRALTSAQMISFAMNNLPIVVRPNLSERNLGDFETRYVAEMEETYGSQWHLITPPNGESHDAFRSRILGEFKDVLEEYPDEKPLFVCHGWVIGVLDGVLPSVGEPRDGYDVKNATLYTYTLPTGFEVPTP